MSEPERPSAELAAGLAAWGVDEGITRLAGDASSRRYFRGRRNGESVVIMDCGMPLPAGGESAFPFARWLREYEALGIRVPGLLALDAERGLALLEDLGDELLQSRLESVGAGACRAHYLRAVEWGMRLSVEGTRRFKPDAENSDDPLVPARLAMEMDFFLVHATGTKISAGFAQESALRAATLEMDSIGRHAHLVGRTLAMTEARILLRELCSDVHGTVDTPRPMALCHRDYHARNLLLVHGDTLRGGGEEVAVIDFQDTRRGPRAYDLASLAWDPYVSLPDALISELVECWRPKDVARDAWAEEVALAAGQRLIKAVGSYAWLGRACGRSVYLQWVAPALQRAHERLAIWPKRDELWRRLGDCGALSE